MDDTMSHFNNNFEPSNYPSNDENYNSQSSNYQQQDYNQNKNQNNYRYNFRKNPKSDKDIYDV